MDYRTRKYFVSGCNEDEDGEVIRTTDEEASFWSVYQRMNDGTDDWIEDLPTRQAAEEFIDEMIEWEEEFCES